MIKILNLLGGIIPLQSSNNTSLGHTAQVSSLLCDRQINPSWQRKKLPVGGFHRWGTPNSWMVDFMENPNLKWMRTGGIALHSRKPPDDPHEILAELWCVDSPWNQSWIFYAPSGSSTKPVSPSSNVSAKNGASRRMLSAMLGWYLNNSSAP